MTSPRLVRIIQLGLRYRLVGIEFSDGACPAFEFLEGLDGAAQAAFKARFETLVSQGWLRTPELMRELRVAGTPKVWEIKVDKGPGYRLFVVRDGLDWVATHGCKKPKDRQLDREVKRCRTALREWEL